MKLTAAQLRTLQTLQQGPWDVPWWGGKPHSGWPEGINAKSYEALMSRGLITTRNGERLNRHVSLTEAGRKALAVTQGIRSPREGEV